MSKEIIVKPIGIIHTPYKEPKGIPIQGKFEKDVIWLRGRKNMIMCQNHFTVAGKVIPSKYLINWKNRDLLPKAGEVNQLI